jgi:hypothetical protein
VLVGRPIPGEDPQKLISLGVEIMMKTTLRLLGEEWWQATRATMNALNMDDKDDGEHGGFIPRECLRSARNIICFACS